jgi:hypothetical protein
MFKNGLALNRDSVANLMKEQRLSAAAHEKSVHDAAVGAEEALLTRTQDALGKLGAGKSYGEA